VMDSARFAGVCQVDVGHVNAWREGGMHVRTLGHSRQ
jgi:hypothetical protein